MEIPLPVALAVLGAALLHAGWNAFLKSGEDKQLDAIGIAVGSGAVALVAAPFMGVPASASWPWLAASAVVHIAYFRLLAGAYRWGDLSFSYPIMRGGGPLIVTVAGVAVFGEVLPLAETLGVLLISAGILAFATHRASDPAALRKSLAFALANAGVIAAYTLIDAKGARLSGAPVAYTMWFFVANGLVMLAIGCAQHGAEAPRHVLRRWRLSFVGGAGAVLAYAIALWAMTQAPVALVAVLRETSVVFAAALGALFLKEPFTARRVGATLVVLAGLVALRL
ncbi:MAG: EamA family transporter [Betaproteobacteria bacterium]|nr:EamA family transporter [Betaproteobacteria bacterium]MDH4325338.1 EamA family transporter [Betaproteobacteria bacterium]